MKRYLCITISVVAMMLTTACEPWEELEVSVFHFGASEATTTDDSATIIADIPYITINGVRQSDPTFYLEYMAIGNEADIKTATLYHIEGERAIFKINGLQPETAYKAYMVADGGSMGVMTGPDIMFTTQQHIPIVSITYTTSIDAKGIMATITLSDVAYLVDDVAQEIESVKLEYARKRSELEWVEVDMTDRESVSLPEEGGEYLDEKSKYLYRVTITPTNTEFKPKTTEEYEFETEYAEITAELSKPDVAIVGDNIEVAVESVKVWFDGVERPDYHYLEYYVYYREPGGEKAYWENKTEVEPNNGGISLSLALSSFEEGKEYEFAGAVVAGAERKVRLSDIVTITIPKEDTPTPPTPPAPPVGGSSDTTAIAGDWHLAEWRGATPLFDVYMSITEDGIVSLWQRIESREWQLFYSTVIYENDTIWGEYTDGIAWGASYLVAIDGDRMTWTDTLFSSDVSVYERTEIPDEVTSNVSYATRAVSERFL